jgi:hypothetical protein
MYNHINSWISHAIIGTFHPLTNYRPMQLHKLLGIIKILI